MGLFTGMSFLSVFEIFFWIARIILQCKYKAKKHPGIRIEQSITLRRSETSDPESSRLPKRFSRWQKNSVSKPTLP